jgi:hypothetical protein
MTQPLKRGMCLHSARAAPLLVSSSPLWNLVHCCSES